MMGIQLLNSSRNQRVVYTLLAMALVWSSLFAQTVQEKSINMSLGAQNGFTIDIDGVEKGFVEDVWDDFMDDKKYGKTKRNKKADEYFGEEIKVPAVNGSTEFGLYAKFEERVDMVTVNVWADMNGYFANSEKDASEADGMEQFLMDFYLTVKKEAYEEEKEDREDALKDSEKRLAKLEKKNEDLHEDIRDLEEKIRKKEEDIAKNLTEQEDQRMIIEKDKSNLEKTIEKINNLGKGM